MFGIAERPCVIALDTAATEVLNCLTLIFSARGPKVNQQ